MSEPPTPSTRVRVRVTASMLKFALVSPKLGSGLPSSSRPMPWMQFGAPNADGSVRDLLD